MGKWAGSKWYNYRLAPLCRVVALVFFLLVSGCQPRQTTVPTPPFGSKQLEKNQRPPPGAYDDLRFAHLGIEAGLSDGTVTDLLQDRSGYLWVATYDGLNRYDGYQFKTYQYHATDPESISGNLTWRLLEARDGTLWVATQGYGLNRFHPETERFTRYRHDHDDPASLSDDFIQAILEGPDGNIWVGTVNGLDRLDVKTGRFSHFRNDFDSPDVLFGSNLIEDLAWGNGSTIWVATRNGLLAFDPEREIFTRHRLAPERDAEPAVGTLFLDREGLLWVGTLDGLFLVDPVLRQNLPLPLLFNRHQNLSENLVYAMHQDPQGVMWFANNEGLYRWDVAHGRFLQYKHDPAITTSLSAAFPRAIYTDAGDILWVGSSGDGLHRFDPWQHKFPHVLAGPNGLSSNEVWTFAEDGKGRIWIGNDRGLERWNRIDNSWTYFHADADNPDDWLRGGVNFICRDKDGTFWLATRRGIARFDPADGTIVATFPFVSVDPQGPQVADITFIKQDRAGTLWLGTARHGLAQFDRANGTYLFFQSVSGDRPIEISGENAVWTMVEDRQQDGLFWLATQAGLGRFENESFTFFRHDPDNPNSPSHNAIHSLYQDEQGRIWMGTGDGLNVLETAAGHFRHYYVSDGLPTNTIYDIIPDGAGNLWISSNRGISRFYPGTNQFRNFDTRDGLQGPSFYDQTAFASSRGELFFGGANGFNYFRPEDIHENPHLPPIKITNLSIANEPVPVSESSILQKPIDRTGSLRFSYRDSVLVFELAALHYSAPESNEYAYFMEGFDNRWNYLGNRRYATYTNLPPGQFTFHAIGSNSDGVWNTAGTAIQIFVTPPWWRTIWFQLLLGLLAVGLVTGGYRLRTRALEERSAELARDVATRTAELSALYTITAVSSSSLDLGETLATALEKTLDLMACDAGAIHLWQEKSDRLSMAVQHGLPESCVEQISRLAPGGNFLETAVQTGRPQIYSDLKQEMLCMGKGQWLAVTPLIARGAVLGTLFMTAYRQNGPSLRNMELLSSIGNQIGVAVENARLFADEHLRADQFQLINQVTHQFTSILEIDEVLEQVVYLIQKTFGYYHVGIGLVEEEEIVYRVGSGELWATPGFDFWPLRLKIGEEGITGWVAAAGQPAMVPNVGQDPRYVWMMHSKTQSELTIPLLIKNKVIGVLDLQSDQPDYFDETDLEVMDLLARQVAIAVENARLYEQAQQLAVVEERNRLARDLHDSVTQSVYSLTLLAEAGQRMIRAGKVAQITENQARLGAIAQQALQEMRLLVYELRPLDLSQVGLVQALEQRLEVVERRAGVEVHLSLPDRVTLPGEVEETLYYIAKEALNNALKHAGATTVFVTLREDEDTVLLEVRDDGQGFELALAKRQGGLGLLTMRERAEALHGAFQISSRPEAGTAVYIEIPLASGTAFSPPQTSSAAEMEEDR